MNTDTRTTALVLEGLIQQDNSNTLIPKVVRWLMQTRQQGHWQSSQESATVVGALAQYLSASGELDAAYSWTATLNNQPFGGGSVNKDNAAQPTDLSKAVADLLLNQNNTLTLTRQDGPGKLYYDMSFSYYLPDGGIQARDEGLTIVREYLQPGTGAGGQVPVPVKGAKAGDLVEVKLTVIAPTDSYYMVVEDPLPAGLESVNGTLDTAGLTAQLSQKQGVDANGNPTWNYFDNVEMRDDKTSLFATFLPAGVYEYRYLARATTEGQFAALPARAYLAYQPDVWGRSDGATFVVSK